VRVLIGIEDTKTRSTTKSTKDSYLRGFLRVPRVLRGSLTFVVLFLVFVFSTIVAAAQALSPALEAIVNAERAFARASVEHGQREAFFTYLADDGITFSPGPGPGKAAIRKRPAPAKPTETVLNWAPALGGVSSSGDMGFTTGPYVAEDRSNARPPRSGTYFTVWRKQPDGSFRAAIDAGIVTGAVMTDLSRVTFTAIPGVGTGNGKTANRRETIRSLERADAAFLAAAQQQGLVAAARTFIRDDGRLHRNEDGLVVGREAIGAYLAREDAGFSGERMFASAALAGDLGYTYGRYEVRGKEKGYYVRLWTRDPGRDWRVLIDTTLPLPPS
jgi:ketosteroid isomerase-like protein